MSVYLSLDAMESLDSFYEAALDYDDTLKNYPIADTSSISSGYLPREDLRDRYRNRFILDQNYLRKRCLLLNFGKNEIRKYLNPIILEISVAPFVDVIEGLKNLINNHCKGRKKISDPTIRKVFSIANDILKSKTIIKKEDCISDVWKYLSLF